MRYKAERNLLELRQKGVPQFIHPKIIRVTAVIPRAVIRITRVIRFL